VEINTGPANSRQTHHVNAGVVISNADLLLTLERLIEPGHLDRDRVDSIRKLRPTHPCFLVHVGLKGISTEVLRAAHGYHWDSWDSDRVATNSFKIFVPTLYEPLMAPPDSHIVIVQKLTDIDYDSIDDWATHKAKVEAYIMQNLERVMPGLSEKVVVKLSASALTSHRFTLNHKGAMLGWEMSPDQLGDHRPALNGMLKNLYFVGHWTQPGGGITPVIVSAMQVARKITAAASPRGSRGVAAAASPPDVRRGSAPPLDLNLPVGCALSSGFALASTGQSPYQGHSPNLYQEDDGGAKPRLTSGGRAGATIQNRFNIQNRY